MSKSYGFPIRDLKSLKRWTNLMKYGSFPLTLLVPLKSISRRNLQVDLLKLWFDPHQPLFTHPKSMFSSTTCRVGSVLNFRRPKTIIKDEVIYIRLPICYSIGEKVPEHSIIQFNHRLQYWLTYYRPSIHIINVCGRNYLTWCVLIISFNSHFIIRPLRDFTPFIHEY